MRIERELHKKECPVKSFAGENAILSKKFLQQLFGMFHIKRVHI
jgi:hypothetical protein